MLTDELGDYVRAHSEPMDLIASELIAETQALPMAGMQIAPEQGTFLKLLVELTGAMTVLEIGTFTGFSALCMARGLAPGGTLIACDVSEEWTNIARRYWERAEVADRIDLRLGPALETLAAMDAAMRFDLAFIDADKEAYPAYLEAVVDRLASGGLLLADNVLRGGHIQDPSSPRASAMRRFNEMVRDDDRLEGLLLAAFDGLTFARRR